MLFNSLTFLVFLISFVPVYWFSSPRFRQFLILFSSLIFYGFWRLEFIPLLIFSMTLDWKLSLMMEGKTAKQKFTLLLISIFINLGLLFYFKYLYFLNDNLNLVANFFGLSLNYQLMEIILPLGISFYTFQTLSYTIDVYRNHIKPEKSILIYGCYVTFFPQLVAGPILRFSEVASQFRNRTEFNLDYIFSGLRRILYGVFLKVVLADNIAPLVDSGFNMDVNMMSAVDVWTLAFLFGFQIYFDFSAYSHIAIGTAKLLGINFPENFNFPYVATSPRDFWKRWHISLSSWIRDYLYIPLTGKKVINKSTGGLEGVVKNNKIKPLFITWGVMGLWHGANWTFVLWGLYHASVIAIYRLLKPLSKYFTEKFIGVIGVLITLPTMMLSWVPFRAKTLEESILMWSKIIEPSSYSWLGMRENIYLVTAIITLGFFMSYFFKNYFMKNSKKYFFLLNAIFIALVFSSSFIFFRPINQFIYFQF